MMDKLYIGDIPQTFEYAIFSTNGDYVTLYDHMNLKNEQAKYYRVFLNNDSFYYTEGTQNFGNSLTIAQTIDVTDNFIYRRDFSQITTVSFMFIIGILILFNLVTSVFKKGGVLGGLL